jgi:iron complex outermembrane receptor protein
MYGYGQDPYDQLQLGFNGHQDAGGIELYANGVFNRRNSYIPYPGAYNLNSDLPQVYPVIFHPNFKIGELDGQLAVGAKGSAAGWNWDLSSTAGEDHVRESVSQSINASLGPSSPTSFYLGTLISQSWVNSLDVTREFDLKNGGKLQVSWGLQDRYERFEQSAGDPASYVAGGYQIPLTQGPTYPGQSSFAGQFPAPGTIYTPGFQPSNAGSWNRNILAAYGELGYTPNEKLFFGLAGRYEHYSDSSGGSLIGKLDGRYKLTNWLTLRGSVGNGFHAATLVQQNYSQSRALINSTTGVVSPVALLPVNSPVAKALGATPLRPEKSTNMSLGFTVSPASNFNVTVDGYIVNVDHRLALTGLLAGAGVNNILVANGFTPGLTAQYFTNAINTRTSGLDIVGTYRKSLGDVGNLRLTAAFSLNSTKITHIIPNPAALSSLSPAPVLFDATSQGFLTSAIPKNKLVLGADWTWNRIEINLHELHYGEFSVINNVAANSRTFPASWITNVDVKFKITDHVSLSAGAFNLFNHYPPATNIFAPQYGYNQYPRISPYGITGGSWYGKVQFEF